MPVILSEAHPHKQATVNQRELNIMTDSARLLGFDVHTFSADYQAYDDPADMFAYVRRYEEEQTGIWVGYIPPFDRYQAVFDAALTRNIRLINSPAEHRRALEFQRYYSLLGDLTPRSVIVQSSDDIVDLAAEVGYPVFVRGAVKSNKYSGWDACVAHNAAELLKIVEQIQARPHRARGHIIIRELVNLRHKDTTLDGFPIGREYRFFMYRDQVLTYSYYWDVETDSFPVSAADEHTMTSLVVEAANRVEIPFLIIDVAQLASGEWIIIEIGDAQFAGLSQVSMLEFWASLRDALM